MTESQNIFAELICMLYIIVPHIIEVQLKAIKNRVPI